MVNVYGKKILIYSLGFLTVSSLVNEIQARIWSRTFFYLSGPDFRYGELGIFKLVAWIVLLAPPLLVSGARLERELRRASLTLLRYGKAGCWWRKLRMKNLRDCLVYLFLLLLFCGGSRTAAQALGSTLLVLLHLLFLIRVMYLFRIYGAKPEMTTACVLLLEGVGLWLFASHAQARNWFPGFWAMWNAGNWHLEGGYSVIAGAFGQGALVLALTAVLLWRKTCERIC